MRYYFVDPEAPEVRGPFDDEADRAEGMDEYRKEYGLICDVLILFETEIGSGDVSGTALCYE